MSDPVTKRLGDYEILNILGSGGMGRVYKVRNVITDRVEAMKVLLPDLQGHEEVAARFLREIKVLAALKHPNIASLLTALTIENQLVMIMEYVEGQALSSRLYQGPIPVGEALKYIDQVLDALSYAHRQHIIHRDIKPANIMLTTDGNVKLMDFGIARSSGESRKLTATGSTLGSLSYMSPEQVKGEATDERSDLYSLGISLYEMVTGQRPFRGDSDFSIMAAQISEAPKPPVSLQPAIPKLVNDLILTSIAKSPAERFQSADAFRQAVKQAQRDLQNEITMVRGSHEVPAIPAASAPSSHDAVTAVRGSQEITLPRPVTPPAKTPTMPAVAAQSQTPDPPQASAQPIFPPQPPPTGSSHRGLYMALGALVVVLVLIAAGLYVPKWRKASASDALNSAKQPATATSQSLQPATSDSHPLTATTTGSEQQTAVPSDSHPAENPLGEANQAAGSSEGASTRPNKPSPNHTGLLPGNGAESSQKAADTAELDAIEHEIDQLSSRAAAVNSSLDNLQRQQQAQGLGLRGDIAGKQASMQMNLAKAQDAIGRNDAARAKRYADMTAADVEALEKFLGR